MSGSVPAQSFTMEYHSLEEGLLADQQDPPSSTGSRRNPVGKERFTNKTPLTGVGTGDTLPSVSIGPAVVAPAPVGSNPTSSIPSAAGTLRRGQVPRRGGISSTASKERLANLQRNKPIAPGQPPPQYRVKDRFVSLPDSGEYQPRLSDELSRDDGQSPSIFQDFNAAGDARGRITSYCISETIDRKLLDDVLKRNDVVSMESFPEVVYARHQTQSGVRADVFYFDYGTVVVWGMTLQEERKLVEQLKPACVDLLDSAEVEVEEFLYHYTSNEKPHIQNDVFTINYRYAGDHLVKLSVSHALAQSTKLSVYEYRVVDIVDETKDLPEVLASTGKVDMGRKEVAQLMGRVFLQKSAVNLLSSVLDVPQFFWESDIPDSLQHLYEGCCSYLEYENRVEVLNQRFGVLQEMLDMLRDHLNQDHSSRLEWIVIILIVVEIIIGVFQLLE
jgi:uncharacterized Rmd1/YagE family protein